MIQISAVPGCSYLMVSVRSTSDMPGTLGSVTSESHALPRLPTRSHWSRDTPLACKSLGLAVCCSLCSCSWRTRSGSMVSIRPVRAVGLPARQSAGHGRLSGQCLKNHVPGPPRREFCHRLTSLSGYTASGLNERPSSTTADRRLLLPGWWRGRWNRVCVRTRPRATPTSTTWTRPTGGGQA